MFDGTAPSGLAMTPCHRQASPRMHRLSDIGCCLWDFVEDSEDLRAVQRNKVEDGIFRRREKKEKEEGSN